jgi:hypothetical protein
MNSNPSNELGFGAQGSRRRRAATPGSDAQEARVPQGSRSEAAGSISQGMNWPELRSKNQEAEASDLDQCAASVADAIERAGMAAPAMIALQIARPLTWVAGQMAWVLQPFIGSMRIGSRDGLLSVAGIATFLETEGSLDILLDELESPQSNVASPKSGGGDSDLGLGEDFGRMTAKDHEPE